MTILDEDYGVAAPGLLWNIRLALAWTRVTIPHENSSLKLAFQWPLHDHPHPFRLLAWCHEWSKLVRKIQSSPDERLERIAYAWMFYQAKWLVGDFGKARGPLVTTKISPEDWKFLMNVTLPKSVNKGGNTTEYPDWCTQTLPLLARPEIGLPPELQKILLSHVDCGTSEQLGWLKEQRRRLVTDAIIAAGEEEGRPAENAENETRVAGIVKELEKRHKGVHGDVSPWWNVVGREFARNPRRAGNVTIDTNALEDRLFADALAADLRMPGRFFAPSTKVAWSDLDSHVRHRAEVHREDLLLSPASMEVPFNRAREKWCATTSFGANSHRSRGGDDPPRRGVSRLVSGARHLLRADGRQMVLTVDRKEPGREILRWRFVSLALPPGILAAAASIPGRMPPERVRLLHPSIAPDYPVAHQHVHHAAMMSFEELWVTLRRRALVQPSKLESSLRSERAFCPGLHRGACPGARSAKETEYAKIRPLARDRHMSEWGGLLRQAFIAGRLLDYHEGHVGPLACCEQVHCKTGRPWLRAFIAGRTRSYPGGSFRYPWPEDLLRAEKRYRKTENQQLGPRGAGRRSEWLRRETAEESRRLVRALSYLRPEEPNTSDEVYEALLLQYLRVKVALFRLLVHPPGERGLEKFLDHFQQIKVYAPEADVMKPPAPNEPGLRVHATEYRVAPDAWFKTFRLARR